MLLDRLRGNPIDTPQAPRSILPDNIPLEFQVLLSACRVFLGTEEPSCLEAKLAQGPDWDRLLALANRHGVMPLLYRSIRKSCPQAVPQEWLRRLMLQYMQNAARNMKMTGELLRVLDALKEAGIKAVPLKGPVLAQQVYGDVALRQFSDLDIMVAPVDVEKALGIIQARGYKCEHDLSSSKRRSLQKTVHHHHLLNQKSGIVVELHWTIAPSYYGLKADAVRILNGTCPVLIMEKIVLGASAEDMLVLLCQHGTKHTWDRLSWICDVAGLLQSGSIGRKEVKERSEEEIRVLFLGLMLAEGLLKAGIPADIAVGKKEERALCNFARESGKRLILESNGTDSLRNNPVDASIFYMSIFCRPWQRAEFFMRMISDPAEADLQAVRLPDAMIPLYQVIRPFRLLDTYRKAVCMWLRKAKSD